MNRRRGAKGPFALIGLAVFLTVGALIGGAAAVGLHNSSDIRAAIPPPPPAYALVIRIDGAPEPIQRYGRLSHIGALAANGVTYTDAWDGEMQNVPVVISASAATSTFPAQSGVVGTEWRNPSSGGLTTLADSGSVLGGSIDRILLAHGVPSLAAALKSVDPGARVLSVAGEDCASASAAGTWAADFVVCARRSSGRWQAAYFPGHALPASLQDQLPARRVVRDGLAPAAEGWILGEQDAWVAQAASRVITVEKPRLIYVDFPEPALISPTLTPANRRQVMSRLMAGIDRDVAMLIAALRGVGVWDQTVVTVLGTGGMVPVHAGLSMGAVSERILAGGGESVYVTGGADVFIGLRDRLQIQPVAQAFVQNRPAGLAAIYYKSPDHPGQYLRSDGVADQAVVRLLGTMAGPQAPDVVLLLKPGYSLQQSSGRRPTSAGDSVIWSSQHIPLIFSGAGIRSAFSSDLPSRPVDIAPTLASMLELPFGRPGGRALLRWGGEIKGAQPADASPGDAVQRRVQAGIRALGG